MNTCNYAIACVTLLALCFRAPAQDRRSLAEKLGYPKDAKLLIVHADDAGMAHSANAAITAAYKQQAINSASVMVPCPWFPEIAAFAKAHPEQDWGIHITLTSEWKHYKWGGVSPACEISSLLDKDGYLYVSVAEFQQHAKPEEVEKEIRAQISKARAAGIRVTHLDNHMGSILGSPALVKIYQQIGKELGLPVLLPMNMVHIMAPQMLPYMDTLNHVPVNQFICAYKAAPADKWHEYYDQALNGLQPGLNEMIFHLAYDNDEMQAVAAGHPDFGATWRQNDFNYVTSEAFKKQLQQKGIQLITWSDVMKTLR